MLINKFQIQSLFYLNSIIDSTKGGLLVGNSHKNGGIKLIDEIEEWDYKFIAELEGWEYLVNPIASKKELERLIQINDEFKNEKSEFTAYTIPKNISVINTISNLPNSVVPNKYLLYGIDRQFVVNKYSTKKYIVELNEINKKHPCRIINPSYNKLVENQDTYLLNK